MSEAVESLMARIEALEKKVAAIQKRLNGKKMECAKERRRIISADVARLKAVLKKK